LRQRAGMSRKIAPRSLPTVNLDHIGIPVSECVGMAVACPPSPS
jgi:hypothetical protein